MKDVARKPKVNQTSFSYRRKSTGSKPSLDKTWKKETSFKPPKTYSKLSQMDMKKKAYKQFQQMKRMKHLISGQPQDMSSIDVSSGMKTLELAPQRLF